MGHGPKRLRITGQTWNNKTFLPTVEKAVNIYVQEHMHI